MANHKEGNTNSVVIEWNARIVEMKGLRSRHPDAVKDQVEAKFNAIVAKYWIKHRYGADWDRKGCTEAIIC